MYTNMLYVCYGRPFLWGEAVRREETRRREVGWLQWEAPGTRQVLDSLDTHRITQSLDHFPQNAPLEVTNTPYTCSIYSYCMQLFCG